MANPTSIHGQAKAPAGTDTPRIPWAAKGKWPEGAEAPKKVRFNMDLNTIHPIPGNSLESEGFQAAPLHNRAADQGAHEPGFMPRHSPFDPTFGPTREDGSRIRNNIKTHQTEVKRAETNHGVFNTPSTAKALAKAKRDLNASIYQMKNFENANADFFRNPEAYRPMEPTHVTLERPLPPGVRAGSDRPILVEPLDKSMLGWPPPTTTSRIRHPS